MNIRSIAALANCSGFAKRFKLLLSNYNYFPIAIANVSPHF